MTWHPAHLTGSRACYIFAGLGDSRYGTPLQEQYYLLERAPRPTIDGTDPDHPAVQGQHLEASILSLAALAWARKHGHPIDVIHCTRLPGEAGDPLGGLRVYHPTAPLACHPDAFYFCPQCRLAWLVDAKRYAAQVDTQAVKDELRVQLHFNLELTLEHHRHPQTGPSWPLFDQSISSTALAAVERLTPTRYQDEDTGQWEYRVQRSYDALEVETSPDDRRALVERCSEWMHRFVLPEFEGRPVEEARPITWEDIRLKWPQATPGKAVLADATLAALLDEHMALTDAPVEALVTHGGEQKRLPVEEVESRRRELRTALFLHLDERGEADAECITLEPDGPAVAVLKSHGGTRQVSYKTKTYNQARMRAIKKGDRK